MPACRSIDHITPNAKGKNAFALQDSSRYLPHNSVDRHNKTVHNLVISILSICARNTRSRLDVGIPISRNQFQIRSDIETIPTIALVSQACLLHTGIRHQESRANLRAVGIGPIQSERGSIEPETHAIVRSSGESSVTIARLIVCVINHVVGCMGAGRVQSDA